MRAETTTYPVGHGAGPPPLRRHNGQPGAGQVVVEVVEGHRGDLLLSLVGQEVGRLSGRVVRHHVVDGGTVDGVDVPFADVIHEVLKSSQDSEGDVRSAMSDLKPQRISLGR